MMGFKEQKREAAYVAIKGVSEQWWDLKMQGYNNPASENYGVSEQWWDLKRLTQMICKCLLNALANNDGI